MRGRLRRAAVVAALLALAGLLGDARRRQLTPAVRPPSRRRRHEPTAASAEASPAVPPTPLPTATPRSSASTRTVLDRLAEEAKDAGSTCFLVARDGEVAGEWYWNDGAPDKPQEVFSVTKSVTSTLVGLAQADGDLSLDDSAADVHPGVAGHAVARP